MCMNVCGAPIVEIKWCDQLTQKSISMPMSVSISLSNLSNPQSTNTNDQAFYELRVWLKSEYSLILHSSIKD